MNVRVIDIRNIEEAKARIKSIGADEYSVPLMAKKAVLKALLIEKLDNRAANFIKQDMLSIGGEAAVSREVGNLKRGSSSLLVTGTLKQLEALCDKIQFQPFGLKETAKGIKKALLNDGKRDFLLKFGPKGKSIKLGKTPAVMGVLNVTPDSFSDGGKYLDSSFALDRAYKMAEDGADMIDIGGESTRPGAGKVSAAEELARVIPVIKKLSRKINIPISIDTYKPEVATAAIDAGAGMINDVTGMRSGGRKMAALAAKHKLPVVLMHMQGTPRTMQKSPRYNNVIAEILDFFEERIAFAADNGIDPENIVIDPGIGFGKTLADNILILRQLREFKALGRPVMIGTSRKSFIGRLTGIEEPTERLSGSLASIIWCAVNGADILRVHDVKDTVNAVKVIQTIQK